VTLLLLDDAAAYKKQMGSYYRLYVTGNEDTTEAGWIFKTIEKNQSQIRFCYPKTFF
jgi:hypothetical protein